MPDNVVEVLRKQCVAESTRPFRARGSTLTRCSVCQLGVRWCICRFRVTATCGADFCLIMHRNETMKPTNTGRLIADVLPDNTFAFLYHRTEPDPTLLQFLARRHGSLYLVFPETYCGASADEVAASVPPAGAPRREVFDADKVARTPRPTFILLDGTWKQARKMFHMSRWLQHIPLVRVDIDHAATYQLRQGAHAGQVSTLEAAAAVLAATHDAATAALMRDYFAVFNEHYAASRDSRTPVALAAADRILRMQAG